MLVSTFPASIVWENQAECSIRSPKETFSRFRRLFAHARLSKWVWAFASVCVCVCGLVFLRLFPFPSPLHQDKVFAYKTSQFDSGGLRNDFYFQFSLSNTWQSAINKRARRSNALREQHISHICLCIRVCMYMGDWVGYGVWHLPVEILQPLPISEERITKIERCVCRSHGYKSNKDNMNDTYCRQMCPCLYVGICVCVCVCMWEILILVLIKWQIWLASSCGLWIAIAAVVWNAMRAAGRSCMIATSSPHPDG